MYPALAVLQELAGDDLELLWVGGEGGMEGELVTRAGLSLTSLPAAGVHGVGARELPGNLRQVWRGYLAARRVLREFQPDVLFFTGGFVAAPVAMAGRRIPTVAFVPDVKPGFALRLVARFADRIALIANESKRYFSRPGRLSVTGYPVRAELGKWRREIARSHLGLKDELPTLLAYGGSQGARSINRALVQALPELLPEMQIIHITGTLTWPEVQQAISKLPPSLAANYLAYPYLHDEMGAALAAADLVISRAGASTLGEFPLFGLPAILVPIPLAGHLQHANAEFLVQRGAARLLPDEEMMDKLAGMVLDLIKDRPTWERMGAAMASLAAPDAAKQIAFLLRGYGPPKKEASSA